MDIDLAKIEVSLEVGNRPILENDVKDEEADILGRQGRKICHAMPSGKVVIGASPVKERQSRLRELEIYCKRRTVGPACTIVTSGAKSMELRMQTNRMLGLQQLAAAPFCMGMRIVGSAASVVLLMTAPAKLWKDWMVRFAKQHQCSSKRFFQSTISPSTMAEQLSCTPRASRMRHVSTATGRGSKAARATWNA